MNHANFTYAVNVFPMAHVSVGMMSYGPLHIMSWGAHGESLKIGNFVSIAKGVQFLLGGNHRTDTFSTYPWKVMWLGEEVEATSKGAIIIDDDVWIGTDAMIMSGVHIHQGAVVAARSVVVHDVPPYAIVAGTPAKIVKYRFAQDVIDELIHFDFSRLTKDKVTDHLERLYEPLTKDKAIVLVEELSRL